LVPTSGAPFVAAVRHHFTAILADCATLAPDGEILHADRRARAQLKTSHHHHQSCLERA
jgi:hypothetical protein